MLAIADNGSGKPPSHRAQSSSRPLPEMRRCSRVHGKGSGNRRLVHTTLCTSRTQRQLCACLQKARDSYQVALAPQDLLQVRRQKLQALGHTTLTLQLSLAARGQALSTELLSKGCQRSV